MPQEKKIKGGDLKRRLRQKKVFLRGGGGSLKRLDCREKPRGEISKGSGEQTLPGILASKENRGNMKS